MITETADWVGLTLDGRYSVTARLGEGGMGFVYRAQDARLGCDVVVKVPRAAMLEDAGFRQRFKDEVGALVKLAHPHIVKVSDFGQHDGVPFAVMQFLPGGSLDDRRPKNAAGHFKAVAAKSLNEWLLPVAEALDFIHKQGYVHRDVKPANILFDAHKNAYISDFGVAKAVAGNKPAGAGITGTGMVLGTPTYMAPELVLGATFDGKIDQYALAVTVFELLAGKPPFDEPTPMATLVKRTIEDPPALAEARPGTGTGVSAAVAKALSKDPAQRYPTCAAFAKAVLAATSRASNVPVAQAPPSSKRQTPRGGVKVGTAEDLPLAGVVEDDRLAFRKMPPPAPVRESERKTGLIVGLAGGGVVLAALLGVGVWLASGGRQPPGSAATSTVAKHSEIVNPHPINQGVDTPRSPKVTDLRPEPAIIELLAGGPWVPIDVFVDETGTGPVTVELAAPLPFGVEAKRVSVVVEAAEPARFELRAAAATVPTRNMTARFTIRGTSVRRNVPITLKRLDFQSSMATPGEIVLAAGQEKAVEIGIDRSGGYSGPLTITVPESATVKGATVQVPADATTATVPFSAPPNARPGGVTVRIAVAAADGGANHELTVLVRVPPAVEVMSFAGHAGTVHAASLSADGNLAISGGADGTVRLWDTATGQEKWKGQGHSGAVLSVAFSADGLHAMSGGADKTVRVWNVATGTERTFEKHHGTAVWLVRFDDAKHAHSVSSDKTIHWVVATGKPRQVPNGRPDLILGQKYKADIAAGYELEGNTHVPTDSGDFVITGIGRNFATLFKRAAGEKSPPRAIARTPALVAPLKCVTVSGDGACMLTVSNDNALFLWNTSGTGTGVRTVKAVAGFPWTPEHDVTCVALDSGGRQIVLGGPGGLLKLWRVP